MASTHKPLTANSAVEQWLEHPEGGPLLRETLEQSGFDESVLTPVIKLPLRQLVPLSQGELSESTVDDLVARVNDGVIPVDADSDAMWQERVVPGRFDGRTIIVTGAASGIGRATASRLAREGGRVVAVDLAKDRLREIAAGFGDDALIPVAADITLDEDVERIVAAAGPRIDGLANIAGIVDDFAPIHEVSDEMWQRVFAVNVDGMFRLTRAVVPSMLEARSGSIVNIASEAALRGNVAGVAYTASKHAVVGITRSTAFMYAQHGIRVNAIAPGGVATGIHVDAASEFGHERIRGFISLSPPVATAEQLAASITFLLSGDGVNVSGAVLPSDGGWSVQ
jgi:NAD(P)-dependent dehydrogenase (short-subunit alcohol dehydrogenase family)